MDIDVLLVVVVTTALAFDFTNGFHDTGNAMAASIATGALRPKVAVGVSAVLNLVGAFLSLEVAKTIANGIVDAGAVTLTIIFAGLLGAIFWNLFTWLLGLPSSSSHALIGGVVGATLVAAGADAIKVHGIVEKVLAPAVLAPLIAGTVALGGTYVAYRLTARASERRRSRGFRLGQVVSASMVSLAHGTNDAQKTMGVITLALIANGNLGADADVPWWVVVSAAVAIGAGTYFGGWRIIRTLGSRITEIVPPQGFAADASTTAVLLTSSHFGFPLSTTQVASGSIMGSGVGRRLASVRWSLAGRIVAAWVITLPAAGAVGGVLYWVASEIGGDAGTITVCAIGVVGAAIAWLASRRNPVTSANVNAPGAASPASPASEQVAGPAAEVPA
jgi:PiT family inorganic phosphate transporter